MASGPSAKDIDFEKLRQAHPQVKVIAINNSWQLAPFADLLYACDANWWRQARLWRGFEGLKASRDLAAEQRYPGDVYRVQCVKEDRLQRSPVIGWGGNGGFQALNLAVHFNVKRIILIGFDMRVDKGDHWHGSHRNGLNNPTKRNANRWRRVMDEAAEDLNALGIEVLNTSLISALEAYPKVTLEEALNRA